MAAKVHVIGTREPAPEDVRARTIVVVDHKLAVSLLKVMADKFPSGKFTVVNDDEAGKVRVLSPAVWPEAIADRMTNWISGYIAGYSAARKELL